MPTFNSKDLKQLLLSLANAFKMSNEEEINLMTDIKDPEHTIKTAEMGA